ncbi:MAG: ATP phosphoribosyltransferase regulatory subunit [Acidobacteriia bacterium]|nr:ATP phosphoribosyltransferase regulatory subunit [Terriglobia bacterium]
MGKGRPFRAIKGMRDILPPESELWNRVEQAAREVFATYGFSEIRLPILEPTELFARSVGADTDIVSKEMYTFLDAGAEEEKSGSRISLRPEATASVCRAYIEHGMHTWPGDVKLYYIGPMFRRERPQKGRYRFELRDRTGRMQALSGAVQVIKPPLSLVVPDVQTARAGTVVEFQPPQLICSDTSDAVRIDSIRFVIGREFSFAKGNPAFLPPGQCITLQLRFSPTRAGMFADTLEVYTPVGMQRAVVVGYAPSPTLTLPPTLWMGTMPPGIVRDTLVQWLVCATSPQQIRLIADWPDTTQLRLLTIRQFALTEETPCLAYPFGIRTDRVGRTCLRLLVEGSERQPYECVVVADVVCAQPYRGAALSMPRSIVTQAGRVITVPVWMPSVPREFRSMQRPYRFTVRCNASTLLPLPPLERGTVADGERRITVTGRGFLVGDTLALLRFSTFWGDEPVVQIAVEDFAWLDDCSSELAPASVTVFFNDYCTAGGTTRLFIAGRAPRIERIEPQPSSGTFHLRVTVDRESPVELACYDLVGVERWSVPLGTVRDAIEQTVSLPLPAGHYVLQARSPFGVSCTLIVIAR